MVVFSTRGCQHPTGWQIRLSREWISPDQEHELRHETWHVPFAGRSSRGLGRWPFTPVTRVRIPYALPDVPVSRSAPLGPRVGAFSFGVAWPSAKDAHRLRRRGPPAPPRTGPGRLWLGVWVRPPSGGLWSRSRVRVGRPGGVAGRASLGRSGLCDLAARAATEGRP